MTKLKQKEKKAKRRIKCECGGKDCNKDKKRNLSYYRNGKYFINKHHYIKYRNELEKENVHTQKS